MKRIFLTVAVLMYILYGVGCTNENIKDIEFNEKEYIDSEIIKYLNMSIQKIIDLKNTGIDELSSVVTFEPNVFFSYIETDYFLVICRNSDTTYTPMYISLYQDDNEKYLRMLQLNCSMNFQEIMEVIGTVTVEESTERAGDKRYMISFESGELKYYFCSDNQDGKGFELYIGLAED